MKKNLNNDNDVDLSWSEKPENSFSDIEEPEIDDRHKAFIALIKTFSMVILAMALLIFVGIAWFTMNENVGTQGMGVTTVGELFSIEPLGTPAHVGIYDDSDKSGTYVRDKLMSEAGKSEEITTWTITDDVARQDPSTGKTTIIKGLNIGNGPATGYEGGINPGSSGEIRFIIKPNEPVNAKFEFYVYSYTGGYDEHGDEDKSKIKIIDSLSSNDAKIAQTLLNGHILLFKTKDNNGKYQGLIKVDSMDSLKKRVMEESYSSQTTVPIYWVWPETLAEIILEEPNPNLRGKYNICNSFGRAEVLAFFKEKPQWFLLDPENTSRTWSDIFYPKMQDETLVDTISNNYALYSSYYNEADQHIGTHVSYLFLDMAASGEKRGSGSGE